MDTHKTVRVSFHTSTMASQECDGIQIRNISLAIQGLLVMSSDLEGAYRAIGVNQVPEIWKKVSYPSLKPLGSYMDDLYR